MKDLRPLLLREVRLVESAGVCRKSLPITGGRVAARAATGASPLHLSGHLVFPGLVNTHDHLHLNCIPRLPQVQPFPNSYAWMEAFQPYFNDPAVAAALAVPIEARLWHGAIKNLLSGVTSAAHHDPWHPILGDPRFPIRVLRPGGWSHSLGLSLPGDPRSSLTYGPTIPGSYVAAPKDRPWLIHLAEGTDSIAAGELSELDTLGCLHSNTVLIHGVGLTQSDIDRVLAAGASVIWCPGSNLQLLGETLNPRVLFDAGSLALGTDSRISGGRDLLEELRLASAHSDLAPAELLHLATLGASRVLRVSDVGSLEPGQPADLFIVRDSGNDPFAALLGLCRSEIRAVVRQGTPLITDPDLREWFEVMEIETARVMLDGGPRVCARSLLQYPEALALEPGLEVIE